MGGARSTAGGSPGPWTRSAEFRLVGHGAQRDADGDLDHERACLKGMTLSAVLPQTPTLQHARPLIGLHHRVADRLGEFERHPSVGHP
jgi:hypothetical protein